MKSDEILHQYGYNHRNWDNSGNEKTCAKLISGAIKEHSDNERGTIKFIKNFKVIVDKHGTLRETDSWIHLSLEYIDKGYVFLGNGSVVSLEKLGFDLGMELLMLIEKKKFL